MPAARTLRRLFEYVVGHLGIDNSFGRRFRSAVKRRRVYVSRGAPGADNWRGRLDRPTIIQARLEFFGRKIGINGCSLLPLRESGLLSLCLLKTPSALGMLNL
jgi:hypothetical protein